MNRRAKSITTDENWQQCDGWIRMDEDALRVQVKRLLRELGQLQNLIFTAQNGLNATAEEAVNLAQSLGVELAPPVPAPARDAPGAAMPPSKTSEKVE